MEFLARLDEFHGGEDIFNIQDLFPRNENQFDVLHDDDDDENYAFELERRQYRMHFRISYMEIWNEDEFFKRFRLSKSTVAYILSLIETQLQPKGGYMNRSRYIDPMLQILIALKYYASGAFQINVGDMTSVSRQAANVIIPRVSKALASLKKDVIKMPTSNDELEYSAYKMYTFAKFPKCIGSIDCTHVKIQSPGGNNAEYYRNRKGWFSLNVQTISSADLKILDIVCRWPGSVHDQTIFNNSVVKVRFENGLFQDYCLVGDQGYANTRYLATPLMNPNSPIEQLYNESCIRTRNCVERKYGLLKRRFPCLSKGMQFKKLERVQIVIVACAVLHNIAIDAHDLEPPMDPELREQIERSVEGFDIAVENNDGNQRNANQIRNDLLNHYFPELLQQRNRQ